LRPKKFQVIGEAVLSLQNIVAETIIDKHITVQPRLTDSTKEFKRKVVKSDVNQLTGNFSGIPGGHRDPCLLHVRAILTQAQETTSDGNYIRPIGKDQIFYDQYHHHMKTGDLILYHEVGLLSIIPRLTGNSNWGRVGMIIKTANKYTEKEKLYILEITRNFDQFHDAFREAASPGINLFRARERISEFPGTEISWLPLAVPLDDNAVSNMLDFLFKLHADEKEAFSTLNPLPINIMKFLEIFRLKQPLQYFEIQSTEVMIRALTHAGVIGLSNLGDLPSLPVPKDIIGIPPYAPSVPIVIRTLNTLTTQTTMTKPGSQ